MQLPLVTIILLNYNGYEDTKECLHSLSELSYPNFKVMIVDNCSTDGSFIKLNENYSDFATIIKSEKNLGFSGGNNLGIRYAFENSSEYVLLLNNDTVVEKDFLDCLIDEMLNSSNIGCAIPKIYYYKKKIIWSAGGYISKTKGTGITYSKMIDKGENEKSTTVSFGSGCCMLVRADVLKKIGEMDENYFLYVEDADLCKSITEAGYDILYVPNSRIYHKVNSSSKKENKLIPIYYNTRNRLYFSRKWLGGWYYVVVVYLTITMWCKILFWIVTNQKEKIKIILKAFSDFYSGRMGKATIS